MRTTRIARELARSHEVLVFDGGQPFEGPGARADSTRVALPAIVKTERGLEALDGRSTVAQAMQARRQRLESRLRALRPQLLVVESFPLSRWGFRDEIFGAIALVRELDAQARVACSIRDVPRASQDSVRGPVRAWDPRLGRPVPTRPADDHLDHSAETLNEHFDALLVHGDPQLTRLEDHVPWVPRLRIPLLYTGYVRQEAATPRGPAPGRRPRVTVSVGGGVNGQRLLLAAAEAWALLSRTPDCAGGEMVLFAGAFMSDAELGPVADACRRTGAVLRPFSADFESELARSDLSVSRAGYNTVVALLAAGVRAIALPATDVSDQAFRAERLRALELADTCDDVSATPERLARMIADRLRQPPPAVAIDLDGAKRTVQIAEALVGGDSAALAAAGMRLASG